MRIRRKEDGHLEIAQYFQQVSRYPRMKLCISSRPLDVFEDPFGARQYLRLHTLTADDIAKYVHDRLEENTRMVAMAQYHPHFAQPLVDQIVQKASGVFFWVRLVVDRLITGLHYGETIDILRERLHKIPSELGGRRGLYQFMLDEIHPDYKLQASSFKQCGSLTSFDTLAGE